MKLILEQPDRKNEILIDQNTSFSQLQDVVESITGKAPNHYTMIYRFPEESNYLQSRRLDKNMFEKMKHMKDSAAFFIVSG